LYCKQLQRFHPDDEVHCGLLALIFVCIASGKIEIEYATPTKKVHVFFIGAVTFASCGIERVGMNAFFTG